MNSIGGDSDSFAAAIRAGLPLKYCSKALLAHESLRTAEIRDAVERAWRKSPAAENSLAFIATQTGPEQKSQAIQNVLNSTLPLSGRTGLLKSLISESPDDARLLLTQVPDGYQKSALTGVALKQRLDVGRSVEEQIVHAGSADQVQRMLTKRAERYVMYSEPGVGMWVAGLKSATDQEFATQEFFAVATKLSFRYALQEARLWPDKRKGFAALLSNLPPSPEAAGLSEAQLQEVQSLPEEDRTVFMSLLSELE